MNEITGKELFFGKHGSGVKFMGEGWRVPEPDFTWTMSKKAILTIPVEQEDSLFIRINFYIFLVPDLLPQQRINITVNDHQVKDLIISYEGFHDEIIEIPASTFTQNKQLKIGINTPDSRSPKSLGLSIDPDALGIGLRYIVFFDHDFISDVFNIRQIKKIKHQQDFNSFRCDNQTDIQKYIAYERFQQNTNINSALVTEGYCEACNKNVTFETTFPNDTQLNTNNPFRDGAVCNCCGLINRQRFVISKINQLVADKNHSSHKIYLYESITKFKKFVEDKFTHSQVTGSEYLGNNIEQGEIINGIRHEDALNLSFPNNDIDIIIANDVFEHVPSITKTLEEAYRVLKKGGHLLFTIPFSHLAKATTQKRATYHPDGITHHFPPQFHGNPVSKKGSLVYYDFGWDIIPKCTNAGFKDACALNYYDINSGYIGIEGNFLFVAEK